MSKELTPEQLKQGYEKLIEILRQNTEQAITTYIKPEYQKITAKQLATLVNKIFPNMPVNLYDNTYLLTKWSTWQTIIKFDWTNKKKYITDMFDCDNFSGSFCARASEFFNLNSAGRFSCQVITKTGEILPHRAVLIAAIDENDEIALYVIESQNDKWVKVRFSNQSILIPNDYEEEWQYRGTLAEFN